MTKQEVSVFWFRRDLRIEDNHGLYEALKCAYPVLPIFIFDSNITDELESNDARISFIYQQLSSISEFLAERSSGIYISKNTPEKAWESIRNEFDVKGVYFNEDYEPYAIKRDQKIRNTLENANISVHSFKDQVIFEKDEVLKSDHTPYTIYTPYKNKWLEKFKTISLNKFQSEEISNFIRQQFTIPSLDDLGFSPSSIKVLDYDLSDLDKYHEVRDIPSLNQTSHLSPHLRFGTVSVRKIVELSLPYPSFLNELIWREFFMQILYHFPKVVSSNFKSKYDPILWRNNEEEFEKWKAGKTGYPLVDAGMRELNATGYMHNRVRMVTAGFLCKHLLIHWMWGEAYFAEKLLDYELAANNGNWQWSAGTGCDSAPYFRVFNPTAQVKKFDPNLAYIKKWVPELETLDYPLPMVDHKTARERAIRTYKEGLKS